MNRDLKIFYEDNHIIVCYKDRGILSQPDGSDKEDMLFLLKQYIKEKYHKPGEVFLGLVHRLDTNTSGVMVFARTSKAAKRLSEQIRNHDFNKSYLAVVEGILEPTTSFLTLKNYLFKDESKKQSFITNQEHGKEAVLEYKVLSNYNHDNEKFSLLEINLVTGRHHQIRAQMAHLGFPLCGDIKYGGQKNRDFYIALQAFRLSILHPITKEKLSFEYIKEDELFGKFFKR